METRNLVSFASKEDKYRVFLGGHKDLFPHYELCIVVTMEIGSTIDSSILSWNYSGQSSAPSFRYNETQTTHTSYPTSNVSTTAEATFPCCRDFQLFLSLIESRVATESQDLLECGTTLRGAQDFLLR